jgi:hypothetical protein
MPSNQPAYRRADGDVRRIGTGTDPYQSGLQTKHLLQVACYGARVGEQRSRFSNEAFADRRWLHASPVAIE